MFLNFKYDTENQTFTADLVSKDGLIPPSGGHTTFGTNKNSSSPVIAAILPSEMGSQIYHFIFKKEDEGKVEQYILSKGLDLYKSRDPRNRIECENMPGIILQTYLPKKVVNF